ncbi:hypothetical protein Dda_8925 [Drechslerella dactyloides]|uniref:Hcy-binding domain-containing protein n=1 Tax=Drechslerella dactyloides TaxID=74499 RepID=A0AAD6IQ76_DREDA|nr:hypothetical protein Dda_8925 [Drechslerella dactyloides]
MTLITILDGATGTLLCDTTSPDSATSPLWSAADLLANPSRLSAIHKQYLAAGATYISTPTYQLTRETLLRAGITDENELRKLYAAGMQVSCDAVLQSQTAAAPALSLGSYGASLSPAQEYSGLYPPPYEYGGEGTTDALMHWHQDRLSMFAEQPAFESIAAIAVETVPSTRLDELAAVTRVLGSPRFRGKKSWVSVVYPSLPAEGVVENVVREVFRGLDSDGAPRGVGVNCSKMGTVKDVVRTYSRAMKEIGVPPEKAFLVVYPDGGLTYDVENKTWSGEQDGDVERWSTAMMDITIEANKEGCWGEIIVGGCCKTTPAHIESLAKKIVGLT